MMTTTPDLSKIAIVVKDGTIWHSIYNGAIKINTTFTAVGSTAGTYVTLEIWLYLYIVVISVSVESCIGKPLSSSIISYNITSIAYNHHTNIYSQTCSIVAGGNVLQLASTGK